MDTFTTRLEAEVGDDGMLHLPLPDALPGSLARVVVQFQGEEIPIEEVDGKPVRVFGSSKGRIHIMPGFDDDIQYEYKRV